MQCGAYAFGLFFKAEYMSNYGIKMVIGKIHDLQKCFSPLVSGNEINTWRSKPVDQKSLMMSLRKKKTVLMSCNDA